MRLKKIKLAGFKSFVDPTTIYFPGNLLGIVGPNGCGKSNVIDAVKWVMGESSAKSLRGESMADVIFSGSNTRKPVGTASVELVFDNRDGKLGGQYAAFAEISVKRTVSRDGTSLYALNGTRCRRRDITDVFLGTGLGPRSYAIIEQGMVSKLIEAKPEELRIYLEEAAGISKYKERRKETESRIRHTRENLDRLTDLRDELEKQINHLKRQSEAAEKYKTLKNDERRYRGELLVLRWKGLDDQAARREQVIRERENSLQSTIADQRELEAGIEKARERHTSAIDVMNKVQGRYYDLGAEVTRIEAAIKHSLETRLQQEQELERLQHQLSEVQGNLDQDRESLGLIDDQLAQQQPRLDQANQDHEVFSKSLEQAETAMQAWQSEWEQVNRDISVATQASQLETTRMEHIRKQVSQLAERLQAVQDEQASLNEQKIEDELLELQGRSNSLEESASEMQAELDHTMDRMAEQRTVNADLLSSQDDLREVLQQQRAELATLRSLQKAAYGGFNEHVNQWLRKQKLQDAQRLGQSIEVEPGWERAVEAVLGHYLEAVCVDDETLHASRLQDLKEGRISLICARGKEAGSTDEQLLLGKVKSKSNLAGLLDHVYVADNLKSAIALRRKLPPDASVVTRDGICLGHGWVRISVEHDKEGILQREQHIKQLDADLEKNAARYREASEALDQGREIYRQLEEQRDDLQDRIAAVHARLAESRAEIGSRENVLAQINERAQRLVAGIESIRNQLMAEKSELETSQENLAESKAKQERLEKDRQRLMTQRESVTDDLARYREQSRDIGDYKHQIAMQIESLRSQKESMLLHKSRMQDQQKTLLERYQQLEKALDSEGTPLEDMNEKKQKLLEQREQAENELAAARRQVESIDHDMRELENRRHQADQQVQERREQVEQARMAWQEIRVRCQGIEEQLSEQGLSVKTIMSDIPAEASEKEWSEKLGKIERRIARLGPINLAAIDEYKTSAERKEYLDRQNDDLVEALETLQAAIHKIDRETRTRFRDTFDRVNDGMKEMFPRLFGGGHGYLELTGENLLETGVTVMARPPGKRNSSIHLLSGGEKAMTAVALLFSLFHLNPAPFCMLDEIDAPLDDANIGRFCEVVTELAETIQFVVVTHSKMTMEMVSHLTGVTMQEPGVSHLVSVDIDEAVQMAG